MSDTSARRLKRSMPLAHAPLEIGGSRVICCGACSPSCERGWDGLFFLCATLLFTSRVASLRLHVGTHGPVGPGESHSPPGEWELPILHVCTLDRPRGERLANHGWRALRSLPGAPGRGGLVALRAALALRGVLLTS